MRVNDTTSVTDPVCGLKLGPEQRIETIWHDGRQYFFCSATCRETFRDRPEKYLKPKGFISRFLNRLAQAGAGQPGGCAA